MKIKLVLGVAVLFGLGGATLPLTRTNAQETAVQLTHKDALGLVRTVNTIQATKSVGGGRYGSLGDILRKDGSLPLQREIILSDDSSGSVRDYKLSVVVSGDGRRYQVSLRPAAGCGIAFFSGESGVIYEGRGLGCPASQ